MQFYPNRFYPILDQPILRNLTPDPKKRKSKFQKGISCRLYRLRSSMPNLIYELFGDTCRNLNSPKHPQSNYKLFVILLKVDRCKSLEVATFSRPIGSSLFQNLYQRSIYIPSSSPDPKSLPRIKRTKTRASSSQFVRGRRSPTRLDESLLYRSILEIPRSCLPGMKITKRKGTKNEKEKKRDERSENRIERKKERTVQRLPI